MSAKRNPFQRRFKIDMVGVNLTVIWGMSVETKTKVEEVLTTPLKYRLAAPVMVRCGEC